MFHQQSGPGEGSRTPARDIPTPYKYRFFTSGSGAAPALDVFVVCDVPFPSAFSSWFSCSLWAVSGERSSSRATALVVSDPASTAQIGTAWLAGAICHAPRNSSGVPLVDPRLACVVDGRYAALVTLSPVHGPVLALPAGLLPGIPELTHHSCARAIATHSRSTPLARCILL